ncbi:MAG: hypothetical protein H7X88_01650, partial [Gloeobacteraceae cyanobacterium ES-bin-316]|nr:hypothetical protein [Ferruginibacter sp.]
LTNTAGWTRSPSTNDESNPFSNLWRVFTSRQSYDRLKDNDISAEALIPSTGTRSVVRSLGTNNVTSDWKLSLKTVFSANNNSNNAVSQMFFEVLDAAGKVLTTFYANGNTIYGNGVAIGSVPDNINMSDLEITVIGGSVTFTHQGYSPIVTTISDGTGNWRTPTTLRIIFNNTGVAGTAYTQGIIIQNPQLHLDYL